MTKINSGKRPLKGVEDMYQGGEKEGREPRVEGDRREKRERGGTTGRRGEWKQKKRGEKQKRKRE